MQAIKSAKLEFPAADLAGLTFLGVLLAGWIFALDVAVPDAAILAGAMAFLFWVPLRIMDFLNYRRIRRNDVLVFLHFAGGKQGKTAADLNETGSKEAVCS